MQASAPRKNFRFLIFIEIISKICIFCQLFYFRNMLHGNMLQNDVTHLWTKV